MVSAPRRSPAPEERIRDAERTKRSLLDAAQAEFAAKGLEGARVSEIAERAGVNKQLISYYFGGKEGLYEAILQRWYDIEAEIAEPGISLDEVVARYLAVGHREPDLVRLVMRENLIRDPARVAYEPNAPEIADLRARQAAGEIAPELDPAFVQLALQAMVSSAVTQPGDTKRFLGLDPRSQEYLEFATTQMRLLVHRLSVVSPPEASPDSDPPA
jgi:TetR/AcrR family transcriptional regulator